MPHNFWTKFDNSNRSGVSNRKAGRSHALVCIYQVQLPEASRHPSKQYIKRASKRSLFRRLRNDATSQAFTSFTFIIGFNIQILCEFQSRITFFNLYLLSIFVVCTIVIMIYFSFKFPKEFGL